jgi:hypothetical protein
LEDFAGDVDLFVEGFGLVAVEEGGACVGAVDASYAVCDGLGGFACGGGVWVGAGEDAGDVAGVCAEVEGFGEGAVDVEEAVAEAGGDFIAQVVDFARLLDVGSGSLFVLPFGVGAEDFDCWRAGRLDGVCSGRWCWSI